ncbi:MAG: class I SAM-dependent methyltransferase [Actinobacteria bacterium]|nr:class I SAM-dependent methyltransferase [Actinomycetota bacterium]
MLGMIKRYLRRLIDEKIVCTDRLRAQYIAELNAVANSINLFEDRQSQFEDRQSQFEDRQSQFEDRQSRLERYIRRMDNAVEALGNSAEGLGQQHTIKQAPSAPTYRPFGVEFDYVGFENYFRGSEDLIKQRQSTYIKYLNVQGPVLDIGCGRGEFLELVKAAGRQSLGVDQNLDMVLYCKEKGLEVIQGDGSDYLTELEDGYLSGIFMGQVVEHLTLEYLNRLFALCYQKLKDNGVLIAETINPHCDQAIRWFYLDPTHNKPLFPEFLTYLAQSKGFNKTEIEYSTPTVESDEPLTDRSLFGDYALIAFKDHSTDVKDEEAQ